MVVKHTPLVSFSEKGDAAALFLSGGEGGIWRFRKRMKSL
jgi:hypothetical protein